ncbi:unnamed protein product [Linum tenue]|uniref:non-specific serine/threonine protein kinase n=1 Tax=Linum tenue TaxID=586396 RepID=A0AAV0JJI0_9ROSI|nr:unnamed protein product [Linum tenue]
MRISKLPTTPFPLHSFMIMFLFLNFPLQANGSGNNNETDRLALLEFKSRISSDQDGALKSWNDSVHFCNWFGVACDPLASQRVVSLDLHSQKLAGTLSPHVANLTSLRFINLMDNSFHGEVPQRLGNLLQLEHLNLSGNSFEGEIPTNLTRCSRLKYLLMEANNFRGSIPMEIGSLSKLEFIRVGTNNLTGWLPPSLGNLSLLLNFGAAYNNLTGSIPESTGMLSRLTSITLGSNQLSGSVPLSFFNISSIKTIAIPWNHLRGRLPVDMDLTMPNLVNFAISKNEFFATIPDSICNVSRLQMVNMNRNDFVGKVPTCLGKLRGLTSLDMAENRLGSNSTDDFAFLESLSNCSQLRRVGISINNFGGPLPEFLGNLSTTLTALYIGANQVTGVIPAGLVNLFNLTDLELSGNYMTGTIPPYFGQFSNLQRLSLNGNQLSGQIPSSIGNLSRLSELYISQNQLQGNIPPSIGNCLQLSTLDISGNRIMGAVPPQLLSLSSLSILLNLSNNLLTGNLPVEIGNLENLNKLDISNNNLKGEIPSTIGSCSSLEYLYMQGNSFEAVIPSALSSLKGLQELDLSRNNLDGEIPKDLLEIRLQSLNLSFNNLRGEVPSKGIIPNASSVSLAGNPMLCGGVPEFRLPKCPNKTTKNRRPPQLKLIVITVSTSLSALLVVMIGLLLNCKMRRSNKHIHRGEDPPVDEFVKISYTDIHDATNGYSHETLIGSGGIGTVYKGKLEQMKAPVAIKVFNLQQKKAYKRLAVECKIMRNVRHRNLVKILSYCSSTDNQGNAFGALVYEFVDNGSLDKWLHCCNDNIKTPHHLSLLQRLNIAIDVASAMHYLHDLSGTSIVHCSLKPSNVLLDHDMVAHVSDFGLARILSPSQTNTTSTIGLNGMVGYAAPEYGTASAASKEGDAYSYGILLLETLSGKRPTDEVFKDGVNIRDSVKAALPSKLPIFIVMFLILNSTLKANGSGNNETDRLALLAFKSKISSDPDGALKSWNDSDHFCNWFGVACDPLISQRVMSLDLHGQNLVGTLSPHVANITSLRYINLMDNSFHGEIPQLLGNLLQLQHLNLSGNSFEGEIPTNLTCCSRLKYLLMEGNNFRGSIPMEIGSLSKLEFIRVGTNNLTGWLPPSLGNLSLLLNFGAAYNNLTGSIPESIGMLSRLTSITLGSNQLSGSVPLSFFNISSIKNIAIPWNHLRGRLPVDMDLTMPNLVNFAISKNEFFATIPDSICNVSRLQKVNMNRNDFVGKVPTCLGKLRGLTSLDIAENSLGSNSTGDFAFLESLSNCSQLRRVGISSNKFGGPLPEFLGNLSTTLTGLYVGANQVTGVIPAELVNLFNLMDLELSSNYMTGTIPPYIAGLVLNCKMRRSTKHIHQGEDPLADDFVKISYTDIHNATNGYSHEALIGSGGIGTVYKGKLEQMKAPIAIKVIKLQQKEAYKRLVVECKIMRYVRHRNLVKILSYCSSTDDQGNAFGALVYEFVDNGSLDKWLHCSNDNIKTPHHLSLLQRLNIAIDVASAMHYLHDLSGTSIVHCSLKPSNVLLDHDMVAHVSDFGLARILSPSQTNTTSTIGLNGMVGYAAPEYGTASAASKAGDVYSYGILLLEILSGKRPTDEMFKEGMNIRDSVKAAWPSNLIMLIDPSMLIPGNTEGIDKKVEECLISLLELGVKCSAESPSERMKMAEVTRKLHTIRGTFLANFECPEKAGGRLGVEAC